MAEIEKPVEGGDVRRLWRPVSQIIDVLSALTKGKVTVEKIGSEEKPSGRLLVADANSGLHLRLPSGGKDLPDLDTPDNSKKYALVAIHNSTSGKPSVQLKPEGWAAEWVEVCS